MNQPLLRLLAAVAFLLLSLVQAAHADRLIMKDGTTIECKIINRNAQLLTIEVIENGKTREKIIIASKVAMVIEGDGEPKPDPAAPDPAKPGTTPPPPVPAPAKPKDGPTYFVVPIHKTFGLEVKAAVVQKALDEGAKARPDVIIIDIDSPGGLVSEMLEVMDVLSKWQQTQSIPLVVLVQKDALSAAALTAMSVKNIYMTPGSTIGAAMIISVGPQGQTSALDSTRVGEKFSSAIRAKARSHAELAGHNPVIVDAMIDPDSGLSVAVDKSGKIVVLRGTPAQHKASDFQTAPTLALEPGKLLTLTPTEATKFQVIKGVARDYDELGKLIGMEGWQPASDAGRKIFDEHAKSIEDINTEYEKAIQKIKDAQSKIARANGRDLETYELSALAARAAIVKIEKLAKANDFIAQRVANDFPEGTDRVKLSIDQFIGLINNVRRRR